MKKFSVLALFFFSTFCSAKDQIIMYMIDHQQKGIEETKNKKEALYYRTLNKNLGNGKYLVQDFYISGKKWSDSYIATNNNYKFVFNEKTDNGYFPREGKRVVWYESGKKQSDTYYKNNKQEGKWLTYDEDDGWVITIENFKNGVLDGKQLEFDYPNHISKFSYYEKGKMEGMYYYKYEGTDRLRSQWTLKNDKLDGLRNEWYENGQLWEKVNYIAGKKEGLAQYWYANGQKEKEENYKKDQLNGSVIHWNRNGEKTLDCTYKNDKKVKCIVDKE